MTGLFDIQVASGFKEVLLTDFDENWKRISGKINRVPMFEDWLPLKLEMRAMDKRGPKVPSIATVYLSGLLAFPAWVKEKLFPTSKGLEFLPVEVDGEPWLLLNCLNAAETFDEDGSEAWRAGEGQIFTVLRLKVTDPKVRGLELFTLDGSNRAQLFATPSFIARVQTLKLEGIVFNRIGEVT